jgi:hypothetical protein
MREIAYQNMGLGVTALLQISNKTLWLVLPILIIIYTISNGQHARKEEEANMIHDIAIIHVRSIGLTHSNIHVVDFEEENFNEILSYDEIPRNLPHDAVK